MGNFNYLKIRFFTIFILLIIIINGCGSATTPPPPPGQKSINTDAALDQGNAVNTTGSTCVNIVSKTNSTQMWCMGLNPWGIHSGTDNSSMNYSGNGQVTTNLRYTGINSTGVAGYPFLIVGNDPWGGKLGTQGQTWPVQLSRMSSLVLDAKYSLSGTLPSNLDVTYDLWLANSADWNSGQTGTVEVMIFNYYAFANPWLSPIKTITVPVTLNGTVTEMKFDEYYTATEMDWKYVAFRPQVNVASGEMKYEAMTFLNEAAATSGTGTSWYLLGVYFGTEYGNDTTINYDFTVQKLQIEQTIQ